MTIPLLTAVLSGVATGAEHTQILEGVVAQLASGLPMVHLQVSRRAATLASPAVSRQDLVMQLFVGLGIKF